MLLDPMLCDAGENQRLVTPDIVYTRHCPRWASMHTQKSRYERRVHKVWTLELQVLFSCKLTHRHVVIPESQRSIVFSFQNVDICVHVMYRSQRMAKIPVFHEGKIPSRDAPFPRTH